MARDSRPIAARRDCPVFLPRAASASSGTFRHEFEQSVLLQFEGHILLKFIEESFLREAVRQRTT